VLPAKEKSMSSSVASEPIILSRHTSANRRTLTDELRVRQEELRVSDATRGERTHACHAVLKCLPACGGHMSLETLLSRTHKGYVEDDSIAPAIVDLLRSKRISIDNNKQVRLIDSSERKFLNRTRSESKPKLSEAVREFERIGQILDRFYVMVDSTTYKIDPATQKVLNNLQDNYEDILLGVTFAAR
jgi:hypothetical protein